MSNPTRIANVEIRKAESDVLVHDLTQNKVHVLNEIAGYIFELCDGTHSRTTIAQSICDATGADLLVVSHDVEKILLQFKNLHLLVG
jgi:hypothetical protein